MIVRRIMLWAGPAALVAALLWSLLPHGEPPHSKPRSPTSSRDAAPLSETTRQSAPGAVAPYGVISLGDLVGTDETGHKRWRITAERVTLAQGKQVVLLQGVRATFYAPDGTTMNVTGQKGQYNTGTRDVDLEGDVHGVSSAGRELFADRLHYSPASDEVTGTGHIRLIEERVIMHADRMVSSPTLGQTRFFGHVHITGR